MKLNLIKLSFTEILNLSSDQIKQLVQEQLIKPYDEAPLRFMSTIYHRYYARVLDEKELSVVFYALEGGVFNIGSDVFLKSYNKVYQTDYSAEEKQIAQFLDRVSFEFYLEVASFKVLAQRKDVMKYFLQSIS